MLQLGLSFSLAMFSIIMLVNIH